MVFTVGRRIGEEWMGTLGVGWWKGFEGSATPAGWGAFLGWGPAEEREALHCRLRSWIPLGSADVRDGGGGVRWMDS